MAILRVMIDPSISDGAYQDQILPHVSRSFALTIPQLPIALRSQVTNAYLLCRIADTIEDESILSVEATCELLQGFVEVIGGKVEAADLVGELRPQLSTRTSPGEYDLVVNMERIVRVTAGFEERQRRAIERCVRVMCVGMHQFQRTASLRGLPSMRHLDDYCYYVAGVVGELLTDLFCAYSVGIASARLGLDALATSFAQGLQMTNILKDIWEDQSRGACWLPQDVCSRHGIDLVKLSPRCFDPDWPAAVSELVGIAHAHLRNALSFTLLIPREEEGIRRFCLWAIGLAVLTLRNVERTPGYTSGKQIKVSHRRVALTQILTSVAVRSDWVLKRLFDQAAYGLSLAPPSAIRRSLHARGAADDEGFAALGESS